MCFCCIVRANEIQWNLVLMSRPNSRGCKDLRLQWYCTSTGPCSLLNDWPLLLADGGHCSCRASNEYLLFVALLCFPSLPLPVMFYSEICPRDVNRTVQENVTWKVVRGFVNNGFWSAIRKTCSSFFAPHHWMALDRNWGGMGNARFTHGWLSS